MQDLQPQTYILLFIFFGLILVGALVSGLSAYLVLKYLANKPTPDQRCWTRDWESIEREINK